MKVLWICQKLPSAAESVLGGERELKQTGGWIIGMASEISKKNNITLAIAAVTSLVKEVKTVECNGVVYFAVPNSSEKKLDDWKTLKDNYNPDVVHIHGTEYQLAYTWIQANGSSNTVVSLQGVMNSYSKYFYYGMSQWDVLRNITLRDLLRETIFMKAKTFGKRAITEKRVLQAVDHVIGRTSWDKKQLWSINPQASYHFNNEILRQEFYDCDEWQYSKCIKHSIFLNQAAVPYKGLHILLKAMPLILREYPDTIIRVAGFNICDMSFKRRIMRTGYGKYIKKLINKYELQNHICFTGPLNSSGMMEELLHANLFLLPSSIENSSNALGEAQMIGIPCVASRVGGMEDMIPNEHCGTLYRFSDTEELAYAVCQTFMKSSNYDNSIMRETAKKRHDRNINSDTLIDIYHKICGQ